MLCITPNADGFEWIECADPNRTVLAYLRRDGRDRVLVVLNLGSEPREDYRLGIPMARGYCLRMSSQDRRYGGSIDQTVTEYATEPRSAHGREQSIRLNLPALAALIFVSE